MSDIDVKLEAWRKATEAEAPSPELMASLAALAASAAAPAAARAAKGAAGAAKLAGVTKVLLATFTGAVVIGGALAWRELRPAQLDAVTRTVKVALEPLPAQKPAPASRPAGVAVPGAPRVELIEKHADMPPAPERLTAAIAGLPNTCAAQRAVLHELAESSLIVDPDTAAAALARSTLLCRVVSGRPPSAEPWEWPWGLTKSSAGEGCTELAGASGCAPGATVSESITNAEVCIAATPKGSCARRAARLQAVFAWCEKTIHVGPSGRSDFKKLGAHLAALTDEFGPSLAEAAWCKRLQAQAERVRLRAP